MLWGGFEGMTPCFVFKDAFENTSDAIADEKQYSKEERSLEIFPYNPLWPVCLLCQISSSYYRKSWFREQGLRKQLIVVKTPVKYFSKPNDTPQVTWPNCHTSKQAGCTHPVLGNLPSCNHHHRSVLADRNHSSQLHTCCKMPLVFSSHSESLTIRHTLSTACQPHYKAPVAPILIPKCDLLQAALLTTKGNIYTRK